MDANQALQLLASDACFNPRARDGREIGSADELLDFQFQSTRP